MFGLFFNKYYHVITAYLSDFHHQVYVRAEIHRESSICFSVICIKKVYLHVLFRSVLKLFLVSLP